MNRSRLSVGMAIGLGVAALGVAAFGIAAVGVAAAEDEPKATLDGRTFEVEIIEVGKEQEKDTLIFANGLFESVGCREYGFTKTPYRAARSGKILTWKATASSDKEGTNEWSGRVTETGIEGQMVWSKTGQKPITYTFRGVQKGREQPAG